MSDTVRTTSRPPWLLPVILVVIIAIIILAVVFGPKITKSLSSPTSTPAVTTVPVTATPGGSTPTSAGAAVPSTATPSSSVGISKALPGATPVPTVPGLQLGEITRPLHVVNTLQSNVDAGNSAYQSYLDPRKVVQNNLPAYGFTQVFEIVAPNPSPTPTPYSGASGRPVIKFVVQYQGHVYTVFVSQPGKTGPHGIWVIVTILPGRQ